MILLLLSPCIDALVVHGLVRLLLPLPFLLKPVVLVAFPPSCSSSFQLVFPFRLVWSSYQFHLVCTIFDSIVVSYNLCNVEQVYS